MNVKLNLKLIVLLGLAVCWVSSGVKANPAVGNNSPIAKVALPARATSTPPPACALAWRWVDTPSRMPIPTGFGGISAVSKDDVWATTGTLDEVLTEHWDGTRWNFVQAVGNGYYAGLADIAAIDSNNVWAVGANLENYTTLVEHWDGSAWSIVPSPNPTYDSELLAVSATAANDIWAVGDHVVVYNGMGVFQTLVEHWDGKVWSVIPSPNINPKEGYASNNLFAVAGSSADDAWAVGNYTDNLSGAIWALVEHWDGKQWQIVPVPHLGAGSTMYGVAASSSNDVWAVGIYGTTTDLILALHWNGSSWQLTDVPYPGTTTSGFRDVVIVSTNDVWAVGQYQTLQPYIPPTTLVEHWNGTQWSVVSSPNGAVGNGLEKIAAISATDIWAVGYQYPAVPGTISMHYSIPDACLSPSPTATVTAEPTDSPTPTLISTRAATAAPTDTATPTSLPTQTATPPPTNTPLPQPTNTSVPLPTDTPLPLATATPCTDSYRDVPAEYWAYGYIKYLACAHLTSGYPDGTYRPNTSISRAELSRIVALAYGTPLNTPAQPSFGDVPASYWAYAYIEGLHTAGVISGYPDGSFRPNAHISRAEIVKLVVAASGTTQYTGVFSDYPDVPQSHWAYAYIKTASHQQWVGGYEDGHFRPNSAATRAELAKTVYLALVFPLRK